VSDSRRDDTRRKLIDGAIETLRTRGIAGTSARAIATAAGVNQALVFYHFGTVDSLVDTACREATAERVSLYRDRFGAVQSLGDLLALGRELNVAERDAGNVTVLAQVLAGARQDPGLAAAARYSLGLWVTEIDAVLRRVLAHSPVSELAIATDLASAVAAAFIGIELYEAVNPEAAAGALDALQTLSVLADVLDDLGPVGRRALRARLRSSTRQAAGRSG
jgi:AcrR family transcriptional regulator